MTPPAARSRPGGKPRFVAGLAVVLVALLVGVLGAAVGLVGLVTYRTERGAIADGVARLRTETAERLRAHLDDYLALPRRVNSLAATAARQGLLDLEAPDVVARWFWGQGRAFPGIGTMAYATVDGEFYGANVPENYIVIASRGITGGAIRRFAPTGDGRRTVAVLSSRPDYDARVRPWFRQAVAADRPTWAGISVSVTTQRLDLTEAEPYRDAGGELRGVFLVDLSLGRLGEFLGEVMSPQVGTAFIVDGAGQLVASAGTTPPFAVGPGPEHRAVRLAAAESPDPLVAAAARALPASAPAGGAASAQAFLHEGRRFWVEAVPYRRDGGVDWRLAVVVAEDAFAGRFEASRRVELLAVIAAVLLAVGAGAVTANRLAAPIRRINESAAALAEGDWEAQLPEGRIREVRELAASFAAMRVRLRGLVGSLESEVLERRRAEEARADSERQYRGLFEESRDAVFVSSPAGQLLDINPAGVAALGFADRREALERFSPETAWSRPADRELMLAALRRDGFVSDFETVLRRADGAEIAVSIGATAVRDAAGELAAIRGIFRDVTEHRRLEERLRHTQKLEAVGRLSGGVAHDFNSILTAIVGYAQLLERGLGAEDPLRAHAVGILEAADRASALTRSLLAFGRGQAMDRRPVPLNAIVGGVAPLLARIVPEGVQITTALTAEDTTVTVDVGQMEQVLMNLVTNAADAMPGGGQVLVTTSVAARGAGSRGSGDAAPAGRLVALAVADTGVGMDEATRARAFEPFFTTKERGRGTGLGLATAYGIVQQHGGQIEVASSPGQGSRFTVLLPSSPAPPAVAGAAAAAPPA